MRSTTARRVLLISNDLNGRAAPVRPGNVNKVSNLLPGIGDARRRVSVSLIPNALGSRRRSVAAMTVSLLPNSLFGPILLFTTNREMVVNNVSDSLRVTRNGLSVIGPAVVNEIAHLLLRDIVLSGHRSYGNRRNDGQRKDKRGQL